MKKRYLSLLILPTIGFAANNFSVLISKEHNAYTSTQYLPTGNIVCDYDITESDLYKGISKTQNGTNCKEEYKSGSESKWVDLPDSSKLITGTHIEDNCKNILAFDSTLPTGNYPILINGSEINVSCDMDTDNGGWTLITQESFVGDDLSPLYSIDDKSLNYTEVMYFDEGSSASYGNGSPNWDWEGIEVGRQAFKFDNTWYNQTGGFNHVCNSISNSIPVSDYRVIEAGIDNCYYQSTKINTCYNKVAVKVPSGTRVTGFTDIESINPASNCYPDNEFNLNFKLFVR